MHLRQYELLWWCSSCGGAAVSGPLIYLPPHLSTRPVSQSPSTLPSNLTKQPCKRLNACPPPPAQYISWSHSFTTTEQEQDFFLKETHLKIHQQQFNQLLARTDCCTQINFDPGKRVMTGIFQCRPSLHSAPFLPLKYMNTQSHSQVHAHYRIRHSESLGRL